MKKLLLLFNISFLAFTATAQTCNNGNVFMYGPNVLGTGGGITTYRQNCLSYNRDLNSVLWIHRVTPTWQFAGHNSGSIQATWMNVANGIWDSTIVYYDSAGSIPNNPGRYPGGVFYNPSGNSSVSNAYVVSSGPSLPGNGSSWGTYHATRKLTGTSADQILPPKDSSYSFPGNVLFGSSTFINYDMQQAGDNVFVGGEATDTTTSGNANHNKILGGIIGKCNFSSGSPVWSYDSIVPGYYFNASGSGNGYASDGQGGRIAFDPSGTIGYWIGQGRLATDFNNSADSMLAPIVYKTINGGNSWFPVLQGFNWSIQHPELMKNVGVLGYPYRTYSSAHHFKADMQNGYDVTVDSTGTLHFVTSLCDVYQDGAQKDSLNFYMSYNYDYTNHHPIIWDMMTDGTSWKTLLVDSIISASLAGDPATDTTASQNPWGNAGTYFPYGARIQVSRSATGGKIFYSWADSDPAITGTKFNTAPDIHLKSYDISQQKVTATYNVTNGIVNCFFHYMSDISYFDNGSGKWISPIVFTTGINTLSAGVYDGNSTVAYNYFDCGGIMGTNYTNPANVINSATTPSCTPSVSFIMHQDSVNPQPGVWYVSAYYSPQVTNAVWHWGDGTSTAGLSPGHNYASAGQYNICVTAYSACGDSATACQNDSLYRNNQNNNPNSVISVTVLNENGVGIKTINQSAQLISVCPNPSTGIFTLQMKNISSSDSKARIYVTNVLGEVVYSAEERISVNTVSKEIDLQNAANGSYFIRVVAGAKNYNGKIVVSK